MSKNLLESCNCYSSSQNFVLGYNTFLSLSVHKIPNIHFINNIIKLTKLLPNNCGKESSDGRGYEFSYGILLLVNEIL